MPRPEFSLPVAWRAPLTAWVLLVAALLAAYGATGASMVSIWYRSETFTHAFLVPPISLWLAWRARDRLAALSPRPAWRWGLALLGAACLWLLAQAATVPAGGHFALVAMLVCTVPLLFGQAVARALLFPLLFMFFCVPVGEFMLPMLMQWTADFTVAALRLSGIPVYREGLRFIIPTGSWSVVEACSGVRYLIASLMVGSLFAYLNYRSTTKRWLFMGVAVAVPIIANWLRAYLIVMVGHLSNNALATGVDHLVYGWLFFGVVILVMFLVGARWADAPDVAAAADRAGAGRTEASPARAPATTSTVLAAAMAAAIALVPVVLAPRVTPQAGDTGPVTLATPAPASGWAPAPHLDVAWTPAYRNALAEVRQTYVSDAGRPVTLLLLYYAEQVPDRMLVTQVHTLLRADSTAWIAATDARRPMPDGPGPSSVTELEIVGANMLSVSARAKVRLWRWYWIGGHWTDSDVMAKLWTAWNRLRGDGDDAVAVILAAPESAEADASVPLSAFMRSHLSAIEQSLIEARRARIAGRRP